MTEQPFTPNKKPRNRLTAIIAIVVAIVVIAAVVVIVVEEKKPTTSTNKNVEFYTWWATTGKVAYKRVLPAFHNATGLTVVPYVSPGAAGATAIYAILSLLEAGNPPATFQSHFGPAMLSYVEAAPNGLGSFVNMGPIAQDINLTNNAPAPVMEAGEFDGHLLSLPVNVNQGSQLYLNPQVLAKWHQSIPKSIPQLVNVTLNLSKDGQVAWMIPGGDGGWDQLNVWEDTFLGLGGIKMYDEFIYGTLNISNPAVMNIINQTNKDYSVFQNNSYVGEQSMTWTEGIPDLTGGTVAFAANGNWYGAYADDFLNISTYPVSSPYTSWTNISLMAEDFPSTSHYFVAVINSVAVPVGNTQADGILFAKFFSSFNGSKLFSEPEGVITYDNYTGDFYATPDQYASFQQMVTTPNENWTYQISDGGLFASPTSTLESAMTTFSESFTNASSPSIFNSVVSILDSSISNTLATEQSSWQAANSLGLGYMGSPGHVFGGYLPYWANTSANRTASSSVVTDSGVSNAVSHNTQGTEYVYISPFSIEYLENAVTNALTKF